MLHGISASVLALTAGQQVRINDIKRLSKNTPHTHKHTHTQPQHTHPILACCASTKVQIMTQKVLNLHALLPQKTRPQRQPTNAFLAHTTEHRGVPASAPRLSYYSTTFTTSFTTLPLLLASLLATKTRPQPQHTHPDALRHPPPPPHPLPQGLPPLTLAEGTAECTASQGGS